MDNRRTFAIILAAGDGKRMKSSRPKVLCEVLFKPMLRWVEDACRTAGIEEIYIVAGKDPDSLRAAVTPACHFVLQPERLGTGHAVMMARDALLRGGDVAVLNGDAPFVSAEVLIGALSQHRAAQNAVTVVTARIENPTGYGRVLRGEDGGVRAIVEERDATEAERAVTEINSGAYWFDAAFLREALEKLRPQNAQGEYYLTDAVGIAVREGLPVGGYLCADSDATLGANDRKALKQLNEIARQREIDRHLENGADIPCDDGIIIAPGIKIAPDAQILPGSILLGTTAIGAGSVIGPNSRIENSTIGAGSKILSSYVTDSTVGEDARIGPFTQLRPGSHVGDRVKIGDFVEIKNSTLGEGTSVAHLTYIGDSDVGRFCNFGCGVVTANYDGNRKYRTEIGDRAFIGCNTNLISPVKIGAGAYTAAGTTVTGKVPDGALAIGRVRQEIKEDWADKNIGFKKDQK
ncbi:bifunctional UDP-N-acetylglucosamine diphosphorylase/glucosamine-1-phosphate N-acetyltransferase GlmU [Anaerotruncus rubiinfantis]|uniref:bifunctional UDP-N-acetylglucosamine diphosphorylase/glucosamine-1-phosphate N-acetyltransferase GlmU n=1 Tax=Anaerotruncus rubiinfantis TaxID=1720200 RepID=UPI0011CB4CB0|nr:bifunctional UDP-N-acetylglucosamine diphosphorylase/glucosamine-1-phosphate N-acetyltransferase GlmU [Anaerotruncus rubiinfantis]